ncbi:MAG: serine hydrolase domain-containing protein [Sphingomicrobium sp.]
MRNSTKLAVGAALIALAAPASAAPASGAPDLDRIAAQAMRDTRATGLAIATIDRGRVAAVRAFGSRNAAGAPLTTDTIMYGASLTKAVFAYTVMQLVDEQRLSLDRPIAALVPKLTEFADPDDRYADYRPLKDDPRWRQLTPRMLLTHSSGFANFGFLEPDEKLRIHFDPGSRYAYSGDGIILLQYALEAGLGLDLGKDMQRRVFDRLAMHRTSMTWRPDFAVNLADGWMADGKVEPHDERSHVRAAGSMDTTIADFAKFAAALVRGDGLKRAGRAELVRPQLPITSRSQFPTLQPEARPVDRFHDLSAGLGVITFTGPQSRGFYKGGHNDSTGNTMVCLERRQRCVVILSNDVRAEKAFPGIVKAVLGDTGMPWTWEYGPTP